MKVETCSFSGWKIYPGKGSMYIRTDAKAFRFRGSKEKAYFLQKQKNAKFHWTAVYRRLHKKGTAEALARRKRRVVKKAQRAVVGMDMGLVAKIKKESKEEREKRREVALKEIRERREKAKAAAKSRPKAAPQKQGARVQQKGAGNKGR